MKFKKFVKENKFYIIFVLAVIIIRIVFVLNVTVPTGSMISTIPIGSRCMGLKCAYWFSDPERYEIVVFEAPDTGETYVKRLIGLPGETVEIKAGVTYINGEPIDEPYLNETPNALDFGPFEIPEDAYFFMGDNRNNSNDARYWNNHFVYRDAIKGKVYFKYWKGIEWLDKY